MKRGYMKIGIIGSGAYAIALTSILENKNLNLQVKQNFNITNNILKKLENMY